MHKICSGNLHRGGNLDQSSTPLSEALKRANLVQLLPVLTQLGVPTAKIKEELIRIYDLPDSFLEEM